MVQWVLCIIDVILIFAVYLLLHQSPRHALLRSELHNKHTTDDNGTGDRDGDDHDYNDDVRPEFVQASRIQYTVLAGSAGCGGLESVLGSQTSRLRTN